MRPSLSFTSDAFGGTGSPEESLRLIAQAGFTHVHWCHHWCDDFVYMESEIEAIAGLLSELDLKLLDCHGSDGREKCWYSPCESERLAGVELVKNRVDFTARLGGDCVVMHVVRSDASDFDAKKSALRQSLKDLEPFCRDRGIRLALENHVPAEHTSGFGDYENVLIPLIEACSPEYVGFCCDIGHHNILSDPRDRERKDALRDRLSERLIATHIHDNSGELDNHWIPFTGSVDWENVANFLKRAKYQKTLNLELSFTNSGRANKAGFTQTAHAALTRLHQMVQPSA